MYSVFYVVAALNSFFALFRRDHRGGEYPTKYFYVNLVGFKKGWTYALPWGIEALRAAEKASYASLRSIASLQRTG